MADATAAEDASCDPARQGASPGGESSVASTPDLAHATTEGTAVAIGATAAPDAAAEARARQKDAARKTVVAAAMAAVKYAAPGQRERVINEAMSAAVNPASVATETVPTAPARDQPAKPCAPHLGLARCPVARASRRAGSAA